MVRGSSHIRTQHQLLSEEEARVGTKIEKPSEWAVQREEREYALASRIVTLSTFARDSFINQSVPEQKVILLLSAVDTARFKPTEQASLERYRRIRDGAPLRILTTGAFSYRKGARDLADVASSLCERMQFRFVGDTPSETARLRKSVAKNIEFYPRVPESMLREFYAWGDVFMFPTIEDGFPAVVAQALASGLPVLTTPNSSGPDLVLEGRTGWVVPIRDAALLANRLLWCDAHRGDVAEMSLRLSDYLEVRDWRQMARDLVRQYTEAVAVPIRA
jgi:glycosyltransferase involved in cell wall biosynthesis